MTGNQISRTAAASISGSTKTTSATRLYILPDLTYATNGESSASGACAAAVAISNNARTLSNSSAPTVFATFPAKMNFKQADMDRCAAFINTSSSAPSAPSNAANSTISPTPLNPNFALTSAGLKTDAMILPSVNTTVSSGMYPASAMSYTNISESKLKQ
ncbi:hypothetical protein SAICODRAFT_31444 [Saitoella complicata NRRL Y-17804]|uniref:uncharacterized protein n=1 Tax=Saitoella complicata (strain BCRC 22490 / CBS 7301 / JCM 7358 / NBRC 10748 / NRRL Y-17804) TaxID=698492 RepID=UPI000866D714|nr:uncharacterized protein SAICODRAFT_31444 [Saitoella complicata NRRL Y-17804]ODQ51234.1 hypothetical protein SAICODRAFT_31444 [Saitoella complicata NRRL Y-17804]